MNVLFVYKGPRNPIVDSQAGSISRKGVHVRKFPLNISRPLSYLWEYFRLLAFTRKHRIDLIHAHYGFSGIISGLTFRRTICSLMGSDVFRSHRLITGAIHFFYKFIWKKTIVKSAEMRELFPESVVIPNGVDLRVFKPSGKSEAITETPLDGSRRNVIYVVEQFHRNSKNFQLAESTCGEHLKRPDVELTLVTDKQQRDLVYYYNAADVLLLTSLSEGSPNVVKEAMACNCPIVSTDVGDVKKVLGDCEGCYLTSYDPADVAEKIEKALAFNNRTNGRDRIRRLGLDAGTVAETIIDIYKKQIGN